MPDPEGLTFPSEKIRCLLKRIQDGVPSYYQSLARRLPPPTSASDFAELPFTTKADILRDRSLHQPFGSFLTEPLAHYTRFSQTSGTASGSPLAWPDTQESWNTMLDSWHQIFRYAHIQPGVDRGLFAFSFGPFLGFWTAFEAAATYGIFSFPGGGLSSQTRLDLITRYHITVLFCTPTYAIRLGEANHGNLAPSPRLIVVAGEPGGSSPAVRARIQEFWPGTEIFDHHGMTEVGPVSFQTPLHPNSLTILHNAYYPEIINPSTGQEVADGDEGELTLTTLRRTACPLIRYRTGDLVKKRIIRGELQLDGGILGRIDDMLVIRGMNLYPSALENVILDSGQVTEYQIHVSRRNGMLELSVRLESPGGRVTAARVEENLQRVFSLRIPVTAIPAGSLPRAEFKSSRILREDLS